MAKTLPQAPPAPPGTLAAALATVPDPRRPYGWRPDYPPVYNSPRRRGSARAGGCAAHCTWQGTARAA